MIKRCKGEIIQYSGVEEKGVDVQESKTRAVYNNAKSQTIHRRVSS